MDSEFDKSGGLLSHHKSSNDAPLVLPRLSETLINRFRGAEPFPHIVLDGVISPTLLEQVSASYPSYNNARKIGREFRKKQELYKIGIYNYEDFPAPVQQLSDALADPCFLDFLTEMTGIENLLADPDLAGGGMHLTKPGGQLDVHVDFNFNEHKKWHRRCNLLLYLNRDWDQEWGGQLELWGPQAKYCHRMIEPSFNRMVIFETSDVSFHGVRPIDPKAPVPRLSFAAYYYTTEAPSGWDGKKHSTRFKKRPERTGRVKPLLKRLLP
jgi:Rps23 Pro-64 3,4-dihydroxylase Tpa1-like proline 4-hydroxylase